jgi:glutamate-1-semialdehyde aminotransferase
LTAGLFGFSPTPVKAAINRAMDHGHAFDGAANLLEARVAGEFTARFASVELAEKAPGLAPTEEEEVIREQLI